MLHALHAAFTQMRSEGNAAHTQTHKNRCGSDALESETLCARVAAPPARKIQHGFLPARSNSSQISRNNSTDPRSAPKVQFQRFCFPDLRISLSRRSGDQFYSEQSLFFFVFLIFHKKGKCCYYYLSFRARVFFSVRRRGSELVFPFYRMTRNRGPM